MGKCDKTGEAAPYYVLKKRKVATLFLLLHHPHTARASICEAGVSLPIVQHVHAAGARDWQVCKHAFYFRCQVVGPTDNCRVEPGASQCGLVVCKGWMSMCACACVCVRVCVHNSTSHPRVHTTVMLQLPALPPPPPSSKMRGRGQPRL